MVQKAGGEIYYEVSQLSRLLPDQAMALLPDGLAESNSPRVIKLRDCSIDGELISRATNYKIRHIDLSGSNVTDQGMLDVMTMHSLESIDISRTQVSDAGLVGLNDLTHLKELDLGETLATDQVTLSIKHLDALQVLRLPPRTTDSGLLNLLELPQLQVLIIDGCNVTEDGYNERTKLPKLDARSAEGCPQISRMATETVLDTLSSRRNEED